MIALDETHDPRRRSWVSSANAPGTDFPIQNLPLGVFRRRPADRAHIGAAIGDQVLDLAACVALNLIVDPLVDACAAETLNAFMSLSGADRTALRRRVFELLEEGTPARESLLLPQSAVELLLPASVGDYTDFYASRHHAMRVGALLRPEAPLPPNYAWVPIAYHGRASSLVASGTPVRRPTGQTAAEGAERPSFGPSRRLDYEVEIGFFIGPGSRLGAPIPLAAAPAHLVGACLLNDWSARDLQKWEYQPLGPFLAKSFATSISPWLVTADALRPFRAPLAARGPGEPPPLDYLSDPDDRALGGFDIRVDTFLQTVAMRGRGEGAVRVSAASFLDMYWTPAQMLAHHTSNGCNMRAGDLIASGTVSGPEEEAAGCLLERTAGGRPPLRLPSGEERRFLEDGDDVVMRAACERPGFARIGFGECRGRVESATAAG